MACLTRSAFTLAGCKVRPRPRFHVAQQRRLPAVLRMSVEKGLGQEIRAAGVANARDKAHRCSHLAVCRFALHRATRKIRLPFPYSNAARGCVGMPAKHTLVGI